MLPNGYFTASYRSSIDDSEQPFAAWIPRTYSPRKKYPVIVALHGMDADYRMIPETCFQMHRRGFREDVIFLSPFGRGDVGFHWMGEADIWESLNWLKARYQVDARRQYLTGLSMGGFACWRLACRYPEQWAAIAPICGGGDPAAVTALKDTAVWCVHGTNDDLVPADYSRALTAELGRLSYDHRYDELPGWGHNSWEWLYHPKRGDTLVDWFLSYEKAKSPRRVLKPRRRGGFDDLFSERLIISYPARTLSPSEGEWLRKEAEEWARFSFGDCVMRTGKLIVKADEELSTRDLTRANHLMLGRTDNHARLKQIQRRLLARHVRGRLRVGGDTWLGKSLLAATYQVSPWNRRRLLGVVTYQQRGQIHGLAEWFFSNAEKLGAINLYDTLEARFLMQHRNGADLGHRLH